MSETISERIDIPNIYCTLIVYFVADDIKIKVAFDAKYQPLPTTGFFSYLKSLFNSPPAKPSHDSKEFYAFYQQNLNKFRKPSWKIEFRISGPDHRYNSAGFRVSASDLFEFIQDLENGLNKMKVLSENSFSGVYSSQIKKSYSYELEIKGSTNNLSLYLSATSSSRYVFSESFDVNNAEILINKLKLVPERASVLMKDLKKINA